MRFLKNGFLLSPRDATDGGAGGAGDWLTVIDGSDGVRIDGTDGSVHLASLSLEIF